MKLIDAEALIDYALECNRESPKWTGSRVVTMIAHAPTIDAAPVVHGRWNADESCSHCGKKSTEGLDAEKWNYWFPEFCPHCGAIMDGGEK